jgi:hypothetical protein
VEAVLALWERWVEELENGPLDHFEYEGMLAAREELIDLLEMAGDPRLFDRADELDSRFIAMTIEDADSQFGPGKPGSFPDSERTGWWWNRLPASADYRRYLAGDY